MGSKKKDLEIIYNLQWKNKPANGDDKANIIGVYDIPATTLNWEIFKSYLLKNSGTVGDDVKVSYITDSNREFPIESQTDFQIALYAFRRKARMGDIVNLKMDRISDQPTHRNTRHSNDVETQFDNNEAVSLLSTCCNIETAPDWFITYMDQFKKNISNEITATVSSIVGGIKPHTMSQPSCFHGRKSKPECPKRLRKHSALLAEASHDTKDLIKSLKLEGKLERKLEKLEHKTKKIKEKKLALLTKSADSDAYTSDCKGPWFPFGDSEGDELLQMDVSPVNAQTPRHMAGGQDISHEWVVRNTGKLPWSHKTSLKYTWGSKALQPLDKTILIPYLQPGETGIIRVRLRVPICPGNYECYYHFHHEGRRFGHWLGCQIIVDLFKLDPISYSGRFKDRMFEPLSDYLEVSHDEESSDPVTTIKIDENCKHPDKEVKSEEVIEDHETSAKNVLDQLVRDISTRVEDLKLQEPTDTNCSSDSDNQSIVSLSDSESSKSVPEEFVVVPIPDCFKIDPIPNSSNENVQEENKAIQNDTVTDSIINKQVAGSSKSEKIFRSCSEQIPDNYDDNNNTERTNQNCFGNRILSRVDDDASCDGSQKSDIVIISLPKEDDEVNAGYAYVIIDGNKMQIPKKILKSEYLMTAEETPVVNVTTTSSVTSSVEIMTKEDEMPQLESVTSEIDTFQDFVTLPVNTSTPSEPNVNVESNYDLLSHCSAAGSTYSEVNSTEEKNSRLFIFPQNCPGYEVVCPTDASANHDLGIHTNMAYDTLMAYAEYQNIPSAPVQPTTTASSPPLNLSTHDRNPFKASTTVHVPNYQQTPPNMRTPPESTINLANTVENMAPPVVESAARTSTPEPVRIPQNSAPIHILPETLVSGAVNVASSAINTARSVINLIVPREQPGRWVNGHWVSTNPETPREGNLQALAEMGFWNRDLNATLLARYNDDLSRVVAELVQ